MSPDFAEQARSAFERDDYMPDTRAPLPEPPNNQALYWATAAIFFALALILGLSLSCDQEFWGGLKVGLGAVCR